MWEHLVFAILMLFILATVHDILSIPSSEGLQ